MPTEVHSTKRPFERTRHRWKDNIKVCFKEIVDGFSKLRIGATGGLTIVRRPL
jgi:hypothetical protein